MVALRVVAAEGGDGGQRLRVLDALRHDLEAERVGELDGRADDRAAAAVRGDVGDERAVDLELVDREVAQVGEGAVAGAVVVDRDAQAERAQRLEDLASALRVDHDHALGDLQLERVGGDPVLLEQPGDPLGERLVEQVRGREVDGDAEVEAGRAPARELHHGGLEHEPGDGVHEAALLDDRQEGVGVEDAAGGVLPAHQRLGAEDGAGLDVDLRLVVQDELAVHERGVEVLDRLEPGAVGLVELGLVELDARVGVLGGVHRDVRAPQQVGDLHARVVVLGHARARVDAHPGAVDDERLHEPVEDPRGDLASVVGRAERDQERELVAAQPDEQVGVDHPGGEAPRGLAQQLVAGVVAEGVVDLLEVVEVDQDQREPRRCRPRPPGAACRARTGSAGCPGP